MRIFYLIIFIGILIIASFLVSKKIGDVRPALLPAKSLPASSTNITPANLPLNLPSGYTIGFFAEGLGNVRDLEFSPGGTLIASIPSSGKVIALPGRGGKADRIKDILTGLDRSHGIAFFAGKLFVAEETRLIRYNWDEANLQATLDKVLFNIPAGGRHFTRSLVFDPTGKLYLSIGSTCDVCSEKHPFLAAVVISDFEGVEPKVFASGLRNSVFLTLNTKSNEVWATEMGRDFLGDDAPTDEINILQEGKNYGWPNCFGKRIPDTNFNPQASCTNSEEPVFEIQAHSAPLGLTFINSSQFPESWQGDLLVAYHGSWNRSTPIGYKVVRLDIENNQVLGEEDFISGFLEGSEAIGRPVDLTFDKEGNLYISDDKRGVVYILGKN